MIHDSSGSPVVSYTDHQIIALHHCGSSTINTGVLIEQVIAELGPNLPASAIADQTVIFEDTFESESTSNWSLVVPGPEALCRIRVTRRAAEPSGFFCAR
jgi:hypothetical protein